MEQDEYAALQGCEDFMRVLMVWKDTVKSAIEGAKQHFPDQWFLLRHDLTQDPEANCSIICTAILSLPFGHC